MLKNKERTILIILMIICLPVFLSGCIPHKLSTSVTPSGSGTVMLSEGEFSGQITLVATPKNNYEFKGWAGDASGNTNPLEITMISDKYIVAEFVKKTYNLQVQINPTSAGSIQPNEGAYEAGNPISVIATPASGYRFGSWDGSLTGNERSANIVIDGDKTIIANFIKQYYLNLSTDPVAGGVINADSGYYDANSRVVLSITSSFPYYPTRWEGTENDAVFPTTVTMNNNTSVTAYFDKSVALSSDTATGGIMAGTSKASPTSSVSIHLNKHEWLQGEIIFSSNWASAPTKAYIQDPSGELVNDLGRFKQKTFSHMAETSGIYTIVLSNESWYWASYKFNYTIWGIP